MAVGFAIFCVLIFVYAALASKLAHWSITMPMVFVAAGFLLGAAASGLLPITPQAENVKELTEVTLALLLFADASTLNLRAVGSDALLPGRLLSVGMLLTILLGAGLALVLLPGEGLAFAALLGAILAPTDAALGLPIFNNPAVPVRIRRALNVESGLNDGIATPFVTLFLAFAAATELQAGGSNWLVSALAEIAVAVAVGVAVGVAGGWLLKLAERRKWTTPAAQQFGILGLGLAAFVIALAVGGNGFIAAFIGGIVFSARTRGRFAEATEFTENGATFLSMMVWGIFGAVLAPIALYNTTSWQPIAYAVLSLTVIRMLPVAVALLGAGLRRDTVWVMGWFGPRGLASVVFTLMAYSEFMSAGRPADTLLITATWTILLSVVLHGLSAMPLSAWYARRLARAQGPLAELQDLEELPARRKPLAAGPKAQKAVQPAAQQG